MRRIADTSLFIGHADAALELVALAGPIDVSPESEVAIQTSTPGPAARDSLESVRWKWDLLIDRSQPALVFDTTR